MLFTVVLLSLAFCNITSFHRRTRFSNHCLSFYCEFFVLQFLLQQMKYFDFNCIFEMTKMTLKTKTIIPKIINLSHLPQCFPIDLNPKTGRIFNPKDTSSRCKGNTAETRRPHCDSTSSGIQVEEKRLCQKPDVKLELMKNTILSWKQSAKRPKRITLTSVWCSIGRRTPLTYTKWRNISAG